MWSQPPPLIFVEREHKEFMRKRLERESSTNQKKFFAMITNNPNFFPDPEDWSALWCWRMMRGGTQLINQIQTRQTRMESDRKSWCRPRQRTNRGKKIVWSQSFRWSQKVESNFDSRKSNFLSAVRNIFVENNPFCQIISTLENLQQLCWTGLIKIKC